MAQVLIVVIAILLHGIFLSKAKPLQSANDRSRWCTIWSLVDRGTFQIDEIRQRPGWDTIDMVHVDGHFYSTKPPLLTVVVAGITWCVQRATGWNLIDQTQSVTFVVLLFTNLIPFVVSLVAWIAILDLSANRIWTRLFALVIAAFGTLVTPFLMTLNNHTVAAASTMIALYAVMRILKTGKNAVDGSHGDNLGVAGALPGAPGKPPISRELTGSSAEPERPGHPKEEDPLLARRADVEVEGARWLYALCGFATGWTVVNELPAASLSAILFVLIYRQSAAKALKFFLPAAAIPIVALIVTNMIATGSWKPVYADYGSDKYKFVIDGVPSYWMQPHGVDRNLDSPWMYFVHCTVGHHGLFSLTPIALLALAGWLTNLRCQDRALRTLNWVGAATSFVVIAFYMTRTQNYNYGGVSCGLRWAVWLTPLWLLAMVRILDLLSKWVMWRVMTILLGMVSIYSAWQPIDNPWRQPWLFQWMETRGWIDYSEARPTLSKPLWTWFATLPAGDGPAWIEFTVRQPGISSRIIRLTGRSESTGNPGERLELEIRETTDDDTTPARVRTLLIDVTNFNEGASPADFLSWSDPNVTAVQQQADFAFVRGLPRKVPYEARTIRYLKTPLRREAFRCELAAAHVAYAANEGDAPLTYRCEAWLTDDVPFGVAQVELQISQPEDYSVLLHERWTLRDCSPKPLPFKSPKKSPNVE